MDKKIGIITFHQALNYGAVLQAYALKVVCDDLGYETHIIDYHYKGLKEKVSLFKTFKTTCNKKRAVVKLIRDLMSYPWDKQRAESFAEFRKKFLSESKACFNINDILNLKYDAYISGSDQIWNYKITGGDFDPVFFCDFPSTVGKIVYAGSSHDTPFPLDKELEFKNLLQKTDAFLSAREKKLADYIREISGKDIPVVLDPTLLAGRKLLSSIPIKKTKEKDYILIYQIDRNPASDITVKKLEKEFNKKVFTMTVPRLGSLHRRKGNSGPQEFLALLQDADFLVTNSFHGVALSLIFHKNFYVYENGGVMTRIDSLLKMTNLTDRKVKMVKDIDLHNGIDFSKVDQKLALERDNSIHFLKEALTNDRRNILKKTYLSTSDNFVSVKEKEKKDCCGCTACRDVCPVSAIHMEKDGEGFLYPIVNVDTCINCGRCDEVCGFYKHPVRKQFFEYPLAYGLKHKNLFVREGSRSGAAFIGISDFVLNKGGVVYGAAMQDDFSVTHMRAENATERDLMKKAKYVQSNTENVYPKVAEDLLENRWVLFSGTPCQVSSLRDYLECRKINDEKLVCCDMICHGVPSPDIWKKYILLIEKKYQKKIVDAQFRDKDFGWDSHYESFVLENGKKIVTREYTDLFYQHIMFRPSCANCQFSNTHRMGDLTMGDFWGIEKQDASFDDNKGVSIVLVNSIKGKEIFERIKDEYEYFACDVKNCMQPTLYTPSVPSPKREQFWEDYSEMDFGRLVKKYTLYVNAKTYLKKKTKRILFLIGIRKKP